MHGIGATCLSVLLLVFHTTVSRAGPGVRINSDDDADTVRYYYHPDGVGARAFHHPLNIVLGGSFGAMYDREIIGFGYGRGVVSVARSLADPVAAIRSYGVRRFIWYEFIPHSGKGDNWLPNWTWHLVGGGFRTRLLKEYYTYHGYANPALAAWVTTYAYHVMNEVVEAEKYEHGRPSEDAVADLLFFDWVGKLIFDIDAVNRSATQTFHLSDWSYQTQWSPSSNRLFNNGQLFWVRCHVAGPISVSMLTGEQVNSFGISYEISAGRHVSAGYGIKPKDLDLTREGDAIASALSFNVGLYYSVNDNPLLVATWEGRGKAAKEGLKRRGNFRSKLTVNIYPGPVSWGVIKPGFSFILQDKTFLFGIALGYAPSTTVQRNRGSIPL